MAELPFLHEGCWLLAGGAMVLYGLRESTADIDLGCNAALADQLEKADFSVERMTDGTRRISYAPDIEIFEDWLYDGVTEVEDIPVITLAGLIDMKRALGREKDWRDIRLIEAHLAANETQQEVMRE
ncbi:MAG: hypothetical protein IJA83_03330 [Clostridia bacterium]|nr:hypothetical protein [Clostridia bacterium]